MSEPAAPESLKPVIKYRKQWVSSCHCNAHQFTASLPEPFEVWDCNCSLCQKQGALWCFAWLKTTDLKWTRGGDNSLSTYKYFPKEDGRYNIVQFCPNCGTLLYERRIGKDLKQGGLNARALRDIDVWSLNRQFNESRNEGTPYVPTKPTDIEFKAVEDGLKVYDGSCHCGAVTFKVKTQPLEEQIALDCNCSICVRNGYLWIDPSTPSDAVLVSPGSLEFLASYNPIPNGVRSHKFCKMCGASVFEFIGELASSEPTKRVVNIRCIDGVDSFKIKTKKYDGWRELEPQYNPT